MFSSTGYPTQLYSSEELPYTFLLLIDRKSVDMASVSEWIDVCNRSLFHALWLLKTFIIIYAFKWRCYLGRISPLHWAMMWPPDLVRCINAFLLSSIYYTHFRRIHSTSALYSPLIPSYQHCHTPKSKGEDHWFSDHHLEWHLTLLLDPPCCSLYLL